MMRTTVISRPAFFFNFMQKAIKAVKTTDFQNSSLTTLNQKSQGTTQVQLFFPKQNSQKYLPAPDTAAKKVFDDDIACSQ